MNLFWARLRNRWIRARLKDKELSPLARTNLTALDHLRRSAQARSFRYVVVDLETTGLSRKLDHVLSIGAFRIVEGRIRLGDRFHELVNPGQDISPSSIKVHGIVPDMVAHARQAWEVLEDFFAFLGTDVLVAHFAAFDLGFMNQVMRERHGFPLQNLVLDTLLLCRALFPPHAYPYGIDLDHTRYNLDSLMKHFGIEISQRHTALGDALATALIFQRMLVRLEKEGRGLLRHLAQAAAVF